MPDVANAALDSTYDTRLLAPPDGQVLFNDGSHHMGVHQLPSGADHQCQDAKTGVVTYARTFGWSPVSVAPGASSTTTFAVSPTTPAGLSRLVVVAGGIASSPVLVTVH